MGIFTISLDKKDRELLKEVLSLLKSVKDHEVVITASLKEKVKPSISSTGGGTSNFTVQDSGGN